MATLPPTPTDSTPTPTSPEEFQIFVKVLTGKTITLLIITDTLVEDLTELIRAAHGVFSNQQRLIFAGRQMWAGKRLVEYGVVKECTVHMVTRLVSNNIDAIAGDGTRCEG